MNKLNQGVAILAIGVIILSSSGCASAQKINKTNNSPDEISYLNEMLQAKETEMSELKEILKNKDMQLEQYRRSLKNQQAELRQYKMNSNLK